VLAGVDQDTFVDVNYISTLNEEVRSPRRERIVPVDMELNERALGLGYRVWEVPTTPDTPEKSLSRYWTIAAGFLACCCRTVRRFIDMLCEAKHLSPAVRAGDMEMRG
jgi:hypothetical protein